MVLTPSCRVPTTNPGATLSEIAEQIEIGHANSQRYFPKRHDLLREIALDALREIDKALASFVQTGMRPEVSLRMMYERLAPVRDRYFYLVSYPDMMGFTEVAKAYEHQFDRPYGYIRDLKSQGVFAQDIPAAWNVQTVDSLI